MLSRAAHRRGTSSTASFSAFTHPAAPSTASKISGLIPPYYRRILPLIPITALLYYFLSLSSYFSSPSSATAAALASALSRQAAVPVASLIHLAEVELGRKQRGYFHDGNGDEDSQFARDQRELGLQLGKDEASLGLEAYTRDIERALTVHFGWNGVKGPDHAAVSRSRLASSSFSDDPSEAHAHMHKNTTFSDERDTPAPYWISTVLAHLALALDPTCPLMPETVPYAPPYLPKQVYSTSHSSDFPEQFQGWARLNPDWEIRFLDDAALDAWVRTTFGSSGVREEWDRMGRDAKADGGKRRKMLGAVRADLFRYLVVLQRGGVYTDIDTSAVRPIADWGTHNTMILTAPILAILPSLISLAIPSPLSSSSSSVKPSVSDRALNELAPPSLIVSIEAENDGEWREKTFARGIQIVQWTLAGTAGHPVLVDALCRALDTSLDYYTRLDKIKQAPTAGVTPTAESGKEGRETEVLPPEVLNWTGPGVFTDALFRYLFARWGVAPRDISGKNVPVRVGDVLILPHRSFQADISEHSSNDQDAVWHGFFSRWKEDK